MPDDVTGDYNVRESRGHWHVTVGDEDVSGQFTESEAREIAARRNAGETWESIESESCRIADDAPAPDAPSGDERIKAFTVGDREACMLYAAESSPELPHVKLWYAFVAQHAALAAAEARAVRAEGVIDAIRQHCRVVYYPIDERFRYIEHTMAANKDMWNVLLAKLGVSL